MRSFLLPIICVVAFSGCASTSTPPASVGISEDFLFLWNRVEHGTADLDGDGVKEWFLGNPSSRGKAGLSYLVLKRHGELWYPMGELFLSPSAFRVLPTDADGSIRLIRYYRTSGSEGSIDTITYCDGAFMVINSEVIHPGDSGTEEGRRRYDEVFVENDGPNHRLQLIGNAHDGE